MHEFSIATQILESVLEFSEARHGRDVLRVRLEIGELMCVEAEQLRFCYDSIKLGTALENSTLDIEFAPAVVNCPHCDYEGPPKYWDGVIAGASIPTLQCPDCGKAAAAIQGHDCAIKTVQLLDQRNECDPNTNAVGAEA
jgi:hydrogenase nickel incorporation protein HypA/HybF